VGKRAITKIISLPPLIAGADDLIVPHSLGTDNSYN
jgi:hypothetical protein